MKRLILVVLVFAFSYAVNAQTSQTSTKGVEKAKTEQIQKKDNVASTPATSASGTKQCCAKGAKASNGTCCKGAGSSGKCKEGNSCAGKCKGEGTSCTGKCKGEGTSCTGKCKGDGSGCKGSSRK